MDYQDYVDPIAIMQVIGTVFNNTSILDNTDAYTIHEEDFVEEFHKIVFGSIYNIHLTGSQVTPETILDYLSNRPKFEAVFKQNRGLEYLSKVSAIATFDTFNYYYSRMKKFTLLRNYQKYGIDISELYDPNILLDVKKKQEQEDWLDNTSITEIADIVDKRIEDIKSKYLDDDFYEGYQAGDGALELIQDLEENPVICIPLYGRLINTVSRGARLKKF